MLWCFSDIPINFSPHFPTCPFTSFYIDLLFLCSFSNYFGFQGLCSLTFLCCYSHPLHTHTYFWDIKEKKHSICSLASGSVKKILVLLEIFLAWPFWSWLSSLALNSMVGLLQREIEYLEFQSDYSQLNPGQCPSLREWKSRSVLPSDFIDPLGVSRRVIYSLQIFYPYSGRLKGNTVLLSVIPWLV